MQIEVKDEVEWPIDLPSWQSERDTGVVAEIQDGYAVVARVVEVDGRLCEAKTVVALARCRVVKKGPR